MTDVAEMAALVKPMPVCQRPRPPPPMSQWASRTQASSRLAPHPVVTVLLTALILVADIIIPPDIDLCHMLPVQQPWQHALSTASATSA